MPKYNLVPHFILEQHAAGREHGRFPAAVLVADLSGFTPFTQSLFQYQHDGAELLSETLSQVFQPLIERVYAAGGFISHFSGDAFTAVFPISAVAPAAAVVSRAWHLAVACQQALTVNRSPRRIATRYGDFSLSLKAGLGFGDLEWGIAGQAGKYTHYARGAAMAECSQAQRRAGQGQVVAGPSFLAAWKDDAATAVSQAPGGFAVLDWKTALPALPAATPLPSAAPPARETLRPFIPDAILDSPLHGEFRRICPVFISFQAPTRDELHAFVLDVIDQCHRHGGTFSRLEFGDKGGLMVIWFGAPLSYENDAARAAAFLLALREVSPPQGRPWRAGLTYGLVWAGVWGATIRGEYSAFGDVVNMAAHIAVQAAWGEIWVDETAVPSLKDAYHLEPLPPVLLKNREAPRRVYRLAHRLVAGLLYRGQMVGRQRELDQLQAALAPALDGRFAGVVQIVGEAGIGKSRLAYECRQQLGPWVTWLVCPADDILRQSLNPFRTMLRSALNQSAERPYAENRHLFITGVQQLETELMGLADERAPAVLAELQRTRPMLAGLVDLPWADPLVEKLAPRLRFENNLLAIIAFVQAQALCRPTILHFEDGHWLDADSQRLLARLQRALAGYAAGMVITSRPVEAGDMAVAEPVINLHLQSLTLAGIRALWRQLVSWPVQEAALQFLWQKSHGNPFFAEQFALDLLERKGLVWDAGREEYTLTEVAETTLPPNLTVLLVARLDRLEAPVKQVVQMAAILGQRFEVPVLAQMMQAGGETLAAVLDEVANKQIWAVLDEVRYLFKHALLREAAYEMQPSRHRRQMHRQAAQALDHVYAAERPAHIGEIAHHWERAYRQGLADLRQTARDALQEAGTVAAAQYETETAVAYFERALVLTEAEETAVRFAILRARVQVLEWLGRREALQADLNELENLARQLDWQAQATVALRRAAFETYVPNPAAALAYAHRAIALAEKEEDALYRAEGYRQLGSVLFRQRQYAEATAAYQQALILAEPVADGVTVSKILNGLGMTLDEQAAFEAAKICYRRALQIQQEGGDLFGESVTLTNLGWQNFMLGLTVRAQANYERALRLCRRIGHRIGESNGLVNVGMIAFMHGDFQQAWQHNLVAVRLYLETGNRRGEANAYSNLALVAGYLGRLEEAEAYARLAVALGRELNGKGAIAEGLLYLGHAHRLAGRLEAARDTYQEALNERRAARFGREIEPLAGLAQVAQMMEEMETAVTHVDEVAARLETGDYSGVHELFWVYEVCIEVLRQAGDDRAQALLATAVEQLQSRARKIEIEAARQHFLQSFPAHQTLLRWAGE